MAIPKSPFIVVKEFLSPKMCEQITDRIAFSYPDVDMHGDPQRMVKHDEYTQEIIFDRLQDIISRIEQHYGIQYQGTEEMLVEWYAENVKSKPQCENSHYLKKKWIRTRTRDLSGILFLSDYQDIVPFDSDYEVYGGKLEFSQHGFGFNPERGTLIIFPSSPHFINATSPILAGELYQVRFHIAAKAPYLYNSSDFPGDYRTWFKELL